MGSAVIKDLKKFYEDANDQHVGAITIYGDASANKAYADAAKSLGMTEDTKAYVCHMAQMGRVVVSMDSKLYRPVEIDATNGKLSVLTVATGASALTATPLVLELA
jgi:hypothetical protein